ncbi:hypothetical protein QG516_11515 [Pedobacter gandavensis]|uniref:lipocalin family protein n=1 Tax=Pedobacter TaxID=84567 RepID=UPI001C98FF7F|nr:MULTISPECIES: lipocalin family protein [Pedobacter]WGQ12264.1 hypothetical protein QG516_11515 [Pedobacter gandavensis]
MKKQLTYAAILLFFMAGIATGCKKETGADRPLKKKIEGKWQVAKVETTIEGTAMTTYTGIPTDFFEFRTDDNDQVEVSIGAQRTLGTYATLANGDLTLSLSGKILKSAVNTITDNKFEFTATVEGSSPKEVRKYYLSR